MKNIFNYIKNFTSKLSIDFIALFTLLDMLFSDFSFKVYLYLYSLYGNKVTILNSEYTAYIIPIGIASISSFIFATLLALQSKKYYLHNLLGFALLQLSTYYIFYHNNEESTKFLVIQHAFWFLAIILAAIIGYFLNKKSTKKGNKISQKTKYTIISLLAIFLTLANDSIVKATKENKEQAQRNYKIQILKKVAHQTNSKLPIMMDKDTRFDSIFVENDKLVYSYTLSDYESRKKEYEEKFDILKKSITNNYCKHEQMEPLRSSNITAIYNYYAKEENDQNQKQILTIEVDPSKCN